MSANKSRGERGTAAPFAGIVDVATISPQTRTGRTQATDTIRPGPRTVLDHAQSAQMAASVNCQRQGAQTVRSQSAVAYADRWRTGSERKLSTSANSPRSCSVRANGRVHEQPMSATKPGLGQSVNGQRPRARIIRRQFAIAWRSCARIRSLIVGRRSPRQSLARPVTLLRSKLTRRPAPGVASRISRTKNCSRHIMAGPLRNNALAIENPLSRKSREWFHRVMKETAIVRAAVAGR